MCPPGVRSVTKIYNYYRSSATKPSSGAPPFRNTGRDQGPGWPATSSPSRPSSWELVKDHSKLAPALSAKAGRKTTPPIFRQPRAPQAPVPRSLEAVEPGASGGAASTPAGGLTEPTGPGICSAAWASDLEKIESWTRRPSAGCTTRTAWLWRSSLTGSAGSPRTR